MSTHSRPFTDSDFTFGVSRPDPYRDCDNYVADEDGEIDELSDPFEILAAREARAGVALIHLTPEYEC